MDDRVRCQDCPRCEARTPHVRRATLRTLIGASLGRRPARPWACERCRYRGVAGPRSKVASLHQGGGRRQTWRRAITFL
jgi:hypothetical protein